MPSIEEVYGLFETVGCCSFATLDDRGGVDSRIAHFFACDGEGLYLRTMSGKPFYRQMVEGGKLSVCGEHTQAPCTWDDQNMPHFQPGFHITDDCIGCGACADACTHKAIVPAQPYRLLGERCDECGNCHNACPAGAVVEKA